MARSKKAPPLFKEDPADGVSRFCPECGAALQPEATPCGTCGKPLDGRIPVPPGMPSLSLVPVGVWAGILGIFLALVTVAAAAGLLGGLGPSFTVASGAGLGRGALAMLVLAQLSVQIAVVPGLLAERRWARALYLWSLTPVILTTLILVDQANALPVTARFVGGASWLGVTALQAYLVVRGNESFTN